MRISYTPEQKQKAIETYNELKSYSAALRILGYPSRHVLFDWVKGTSHKKSGEGSPYKAKHHTWQLKLNAVEMVLVGKDIREVAAELGITNYVIVYEWIRRWRTRGSSGLMTKKEQMETGVYKTKAQLEKALPNDVGKLRDLAVGLLARNAILEQELELAKKEAGDIPDNCHRSSRPR